jgi:DNA polymerase III sliding clamp (beta) subunit (PCNA family)
MGKTKKKIQAKFRIEKSMFKKIIKAQYETSAHFSNNVLSGIKFEYENGVLILVSTDGNRLLVNEICVEDGEGDACEALYNGVMLGKIQILKNLMFSNSNYIDYLEFTMTPENLTIEDPANRIVYNINSVFGEYPKWRQIIPNIAEEEKDKYTQIALNVRFLKELEKMSVNPRTNIIKLQFKNNSPLSMIAVESEVGDIIKSKTLIMPIQTDE